MAVPKKPVPFSSFGSDFFVLKKTNPEYTKIARKIEERVECKMTIEDRNTLKTGVIQNLILENREKLSISGVNDVLSFDDQVVMVETDLGLLTVKGENLKINKLSIDTSEVIVEGEISYLAYSDKTEERGKSQGLLSKIFK